MAKLGRPTKKTPETVKVILAALERGLPYRWAANIAGVHASTFWEWHTDDPDFASQCDAARAKFIDNTVAVCRVHPPTALKLLERLVREDFRPPTQRLEIEKIPGLEIVDDDAPDQVSGPASEAEGD